MRRGDKYVIGERLAADDGIEVFRANVVGAEGFARPVEIHRLSHAHSMDRAYAERFIARASAAAALAHRNVVGVLDVDRDEEGRLFLATEHIEGAWLDAVLARGALPEAIAIHIAAEVLHGLAHAHELGLAHGGVSSAGVRLGWSGNVKLSDLVTGRLRAGTEPDTTDHRRDLVAIGELLSELVPRRRDPEVVRVMRRLAASDPAVAYPSARAAIADLVGSVRHPRDGRELVAATLRRRFPSRAPTRAKEPRARRRTRTAVLAIAAAVLVVAVPAVVLLRGTAEVDVPSPDAVPPPDGDPDALLKAVANAVSDDLNNRASACDAPRDGAYSVQIEVTPDGRLSSLVFTPSDAFTTCVRKAVRTSGFPRKPDGIAVSISWNWVTVGSSGE